MDRAKQPDANGETRSREAGAQDARDDRFEGDRRAPRTGVSPALLGAELAGERDEDRDSETGELLRRAAENDTRV